MNENKYRLIFSPMYIDGVITIDVVDYEGMTHSLIYPSFEEAEIAWKRLKQGESIED